MPLPVEKKHVEIYLDRDGKAPFSNWVDDLSDLKGRAIWKDYKERDNEN